MKSHDIDLSRYDQEILSDALDRVEAAAEVLRDKAKSNLRSKLKGTWTEHGPYKTGKYGGKLWTERIKGEMVETIRVVRSKSPRVKNILVIAGTWKTWWATQLEYGRGQWRGGHRAYMRPAIKETESTMKTILESGSGATK